MFAPAHARGRCVTCPEDARPAAPQRAPNPGRDPSGGEGGGRTGTRRGRQPLRHREQETGAASWGGLRVKGRWGEEDEVEVRRAGAGSDQLQCPRPGVGRPSPAPPQLPFGPRAPRPPRPAPRGTGLRVALPVGSQGWREVTGHRGQRWRMGVKPAGRSGCGGPARPVAPAEAHLRGGGLRARLCGADAAAAEAAAATSGAAAAAAAAEAAVGRFPRLRVSALCPPHPAPPAQPPG